MKQTTEEVAVLMTCHNRCKQTLDCLSALEGQEGIEDFSIHVYLVDDGCKDGTREAVANAFPKTNILTGDGHLYWAGGMRFAMREAMRAQHDYFLWLNDDTILEKHAIRVLLDSAYKLKSKGGGVIVAGSVCDPNTGRLTYGGFISTKRFLGLEHLQPSDKPLQCDTFNGNCVLVPSCVALRLGNISHEFTHSMGDIDYGLRGKEIGVGSWIAPGFLGNCTSNSHKERWTNPAVPLRERLSILREPTGFLAWDFARLAKRHVGWLWPLYLAKVYLRVLFPRRRVMSK